MSKSGNRSKLLNLTKTENTKSATNLRHGKKKETHIMLRQDADTDYSPSKRFKLRRSNANVKKITWEKLHATEEDKEDGKTHTTSLKTNTRSDQRST